MNKYTSLQKSHRRYLEEFLGNYQKLNKSHHTIKNYSSDLHKFIKWFEYTRSYDISRASAQDIDRYKDFLSGTAAHKRSGLLKRIWKKLFQKTSSGNYIVQSPLSVGSKRRHISAIKNFYEYMIQAYDGKLAGFKDNPVKSKIHTIKLKDADIEHTKLLTERDFDSVLKATKNSSEKLMIYLLYYGGLRLEELTRVKISSFSQKNQTLSLIRKGGSLHTYKLENFHEIFELMIRFIDRRHMNNDNLFLNKFGNPISSRSMYARIRKLLKRASLRTVGLGPHSFRKACATNLYVKTKDILLVRNYLNHKDAKVTQTYIEYYQ